MFTCTEEGKNEKKGKENKKQKTVIFNLKYVQQADYVCRAYFS